MILRRILWGAALVGLVLLGLFGGAMPPLALLGGAVVALTLLLFLVLDFMLDRWLRRHLGGDVTPGLFLRQRLGSVVSAAASIYGLGAAVLGLSGLLEDALGTALLRGSAVLGGIAIVAMIGQAVARPARKQANPLAELRTKLGVKPLSVQLREARDFQATCGMRIFPPMLKVWAFSAAIVIGMWIVCGGIAALVVWASDQFVLYDPGNWPLLMKLALLAGLGGTSAMGATALLATFRMVNRIRRVGRIDSSRLWRETGLSFETVGVWGSLGWGLGMLLALGVLGLAAASIHLALVEIFSLPWVLGLPVATIAFATGMWIMVLLPQMYLFPVLLKRDCGWMRGIEASIHLVALEGREAISKAITATVMALTIVGIPGALHLLVASLDYEDLLLAAILGEKSAREVQEAMVALDSTTPAALKKHFEQLERGRYLDALNGFQMHLRTHRDDVEAQRGEALAFLHMGNPRARESLERWQRLAPDSEEANRLLAEFNAGEWAEKGRRFLEAQARCTQHIGVGVRGIA